MKWRFLRHASRWRSGPLGSGRRPALLRIAGALVRPDGSRVLAARRGPRTRRCPRGSTRRRRWPAWPRGATGEMRRTAKTTLDAAANDLESTVRSLTRQAAPSGGRQRRGGCAFPDTGRIQRTQYRSELRSSPDSVDWMGVLGLVHEVVRGGQALRRYGTRRQSRCHGQGLLPSLQLEPVTPTGSAGSEGS